jgi:alkylation response protein AidB-like acyl-CoA dehydrogenase
MNFTPTQEQAALQESVRRFREREYAFERRLELMRSPEGFSREAWATFAELGWPGAGLAEDQGGYGGGPVENALILEEMGRGLMLEPFLPSIGAIQAIAALAGPDQRDALLGPIISGEIIAVLADREGRETTATPNGDGWTLSGTKTFVLGGPQADVVLVSAHAPGGISLFQVATEGPGMMRRDYRAVDGRRVSDFQFENARLGSGALVGAEGAALPAVELATDHLLIGACAEALGAMDAAMWMTRDYLKTRKQFGVALNTFQALQHRMADMLVETELARSMLYRGLAVLSQDDPLERRKVVAAVKAQIGEAGYKVGAAAVQLHGGIGVTEEYALGHYFKRLTFVRGFGGASDEHFARFAQLSRSAA